jgi:tetratricopeptide (TPR) repeat protein
VKLYAALVVVIALAAGPAEGATPAQGAQLFEAGKLGEARKIFEPAAKTDAQAAYYLGRIELASQQAGKAIEWLEKATELAPKNADYLYWLGRAYGQAALTANLLSQGIVRQAKSGRGGSHVDIGQQSGNLSKGTRQVRILPGRGWPPAGSESCVGGHRKGTCEA